MKFAQFIFLFAMLIVALALSVLFMKGVLVLIGAKATWSAAFGALVLANVGIIGLLGKNNQEGAQ